jgi:hypothetical protein
LEKARAEVDISVLHPAARPRRLRAVVASWFGTAAEPYRIEYIVCHHLAQAAEFGSLGDLRREFERLAVVVNGAANHPTLNGRSSFVDNVNQAAARARGDVLVLATDDLEPPQHWDERILAALALPAPLRRLRDGRMQLEAILSCSNGDAQSDARDLVLHPIMTRARYERQGWIFPADYSGVYSDTELTVRGRIDGVVVAAPHIVFRHRHPDYDPAAAQDQIYRWQNAPEEYARGLAIIKARAQLGFPHRDEPRGPHPVELYFDGG